MWLVGKGELDSVVGCSPFSVMCVRGFSIDLLSAVFSLG